MPLTRPLVMKRGEKSEQGGHEGPRSTSASRITTLVESNSTTRNSTLSSSTGWLLTTTTAFDSMDAAPGLELFSTYEAEYGQLYTAIRRTLDKEAKLAVGGGRRFTLNVARLHG